MSIRKFQFYIVPTPIGNIEDITLRALNVLKEVDLIACEDTRVTQKLLNHYEINKKCVSYHKYNENERVAFFLNELNQGKTVALVSDAGTPMICDPGEVLIRELLENNISINSLPGACAITTFLSQIPRETEEFSFIGFLPRNEKQIEEVVKKHLKTNMVFYDSPERILKDLKIIRNIFGDLKISLGRELTKLYEEITTDTISKILEHYKNGIKGEIVCMIHAYNLENNLDIDLQIKALKSKGFKDKEISTILTTLFDLNKNEIYKRTIELKD